jgi:hypothetical protein
VPVAVVFALPAPAQQANAASTQSDSIEIQNAVNSRVTPTEWRQQMVRHMTSRMLEGRRVLRSNGHSLGFVLAVNDIGVDVDVQTNGDRAITLAESELA